MKFEWDPRKNESNRRKHGIKFEMAVLIFEGQVVETFDDREEYREERVVARGLLGESVVVVVYTERGKKRRIITARKANKKERREYYNALQRHENESDDPLRMG